MNIFNKAISRCLCLALFCGSFSACKKNIDEALPDDQQDIRINYYAASEVLPAANFNVDITLYQAGNQYQQHKTAFRFEDNYDFNVYPQPYQYSDDRQISYARYIAQPYKVAFMTENTALVDTLIDLEPATFQCLYLVDYLTAQDAAPKYGLLSINEPRDGVTEGQVGVRFINLSPEAASLQTVFRPVSGNERSLSVVSFLQASEYRYFEPGDAENGLLRFKLVDTDGTTLYTAVPAITGRSYDIVVRGFKSNQRRQVANNSGQGISTINIPNNFRAVVRRTY